MKTVSWITFFYALLVLAGGITGHLIAKSVASLIAGIAFGCLLIFCAIGIYRDHLFPAYSGIILIFFLSIFFGYRWLYSLNFIPSGLMCLISVIVFIANGILIRKHLRKREN